MPRSIWNGAVSFGMVSIPVKLYTATESKDVAFRTLHQECGSRLKQLRWCPVCEREVEWAEVQRGFEYTKDEYVVLDDDDFEKLPLPSKHTIDLTAFVDASEIDPIYHEKSYYLEADEVGQKPFVLLMKALQEKGLTAIAKIAIRNKEQLCALRAYDGRLMLETLFYPDELRVEKGVDLPEVDVSNKELKMAFSLIDLMVEEFDPEKYNDQYREALMEIINAKLEGQEIVAAPAAAEGKVVDLMSALKASVDAAKGKQESKPKRGRASAARTKRKAATG